MLALGCLGVSLCLGRLFWNKEYSHTFFAYLFILDSSLACMVASWLWFVTSRLGSSRPAPTWRLVSDRHNPSTFLGVDVHYLKFTSAILSRDMTSGVTVETIGDDLWRVVTTRRAVTIRREASPFCDPLRIGYIGHECDPYMYIMIGPNFYKYI